MYVHCSCGKTHWGPRGAAGVLITDPARTGVVLQKRSRLVHHGGTWGVPGGAIEDGETPMQAAFREAHEEAGVLAESLTVLGTMVGTDHLEWSYTYVLTERERPADPVLPSRSWEADRTLWVDLAAASELPLHPGLRRDWPELARWLTQELD